ncbi:MAG: Hsp20/alpha crystallin family protein [Panacagrimonas sp.]
MERPFTLMQRLSEEMDRQFSEFFGGRLGSTPTFSGGSSLSGAWRPQIEVLEKDKQLLVRADLPGMTKDDINIEMQDDMLMISGERRSEHSESREGLHHSERRYGRFMRSVQLPEGVDPEQIKASFENGVLEVCMPCPDHKSSSRRIAIQGASAEGKKGESEDRATAATERANKLQ